MKFVSLLDIVLHAMADKGWFRHAPSYGIYRLTDESILGAIQTISLWSLQSPRTKATSSDLIQIEIYVRLKVLEEFILTHFGAQYANEFGKTVGIFLHRLVPTGGDSSGGFYIAGGLSAGNKSCARLVHAVDSYGIPFLRRIASGQTLLDGVGVDARTVDPLKWEVRRSVFLIATDYSVRSDVVLAEARSRLVNALNEKFTLIAKFNNNLDVKAEIDSRLQSFSEFSTKILNDPESMLEFRQKMKLCENL